MDIVFHWCPCAYCSTYCR